MLLADQATLRDVILFPAMRSLANDSAERLETNDSAESLETDETVDEKVRRP
jgi:hypothetical protein